MNQPTDSAKNIIRPRSTRRDFLAGSLATLAAGTLLARQRQASDTPKDPAQIAITLDLEMSAQFPRPGMTEWNFEKGNLDADTKAYAVEAARRVKAKGGRIHFFALGRTLEQENIDLAGRLATAQIRRLEAEKQQLEARLAAARGKDERP